MAERKSLADLGQAMGVAAAPGSTAPAAPVKPKLDAQGLVVRLTAAHASDNIPAEDNITASRWRLLVERLDFGRGQTHP